MIAFHKQEIITSRNDNAIKRIRNLHHREERNRTGHYYIEGMRFVARAAEHKHLIQTLVYSPALLTHPFAEKLVRRQQKAGTSCRQVVPEVLQSLALNDDSQGIGAVVSQRWHSLQNVDPAGDLCWVVLESVQSPGNLGTIVRTSEAIGAAGIILIGESIDAYHPATVRASMVAMFKQRFIRTRAADFAEWKRQHGCQLVGTSPAAGRHYRAVQYRSPVLLFMGNERKGLSKEQLGMCDAVVNLPMVGEADSLNLAVSTGVMLYEIFDQCAPASPHHKQEITVAAE